MTETVVPKPEEPSVWKWAFKIAGTIGLTGMLCCVAPAVLFMFGLMGGVYAVSFANFFYAEDGSIGPAGWALRIGAGLLGVIGFMLFRRKQNQCSVDPKRKRKNLMLVSGLILVLGLGFFLTFDKLSSWYFEEVVDPAKTEEIQQGE